MSGGPIYAAVLTVSDRCSRGETVDGSGPAVEEMLRSKLGVRVAAVRCVPDEKEQIAASLLDWAREGVDLVVSTGGTGLALRDVTPEAARSVFEREAPGLMELARLRCMAKTPRAFLSRGVAGTIGRTLILTLPGSVRGATETLGALLDVLPHAVATLRGEVRDEGRTEAHPEIRPVVLVGGRSTRFGRDKLREPLEGGGMLVMRPIAALREVFGARVALVGEAHPDVLAAGDEAVADGRPGMGPMGGLASALRGEEAVFVLAGDMPGVTAEDVRKVLAAAAEAPQAWAVLAATNREHPCFGLYRRECLATLEEHLSAGRLGMTGALPRERVVFTPCSKEAVRNVNTPADLRNG